MASNQRKLNGEPTIHKSMTNMEKNFEKEVGELKRQIASLQRRLETVENVLDSAKETLTLEEAARFMGIAKSSLYKMTHEQTIPYYKPNGKMVYFEKAVLTEWIRQNRVMSQSEIDAAATKYLNQLSHR